MSLPNTSVSIPVYYLSSANVDALTGCRPIQYCHYFKCIFFPSETQVWKGSFGVWQACKGMCLCTENKNLKQMRPLRLNTQMLIITAVRKGCGGTDIVINLRDKAAQYSSKLI